jgi:hypothetical protein
MVELPGNYRLIWTGIKVLKQDGSLRHGVAIQPNVPVAPTRRGLAEGRDEVLEKVGRGERKLRSPRSRECPVPRSTSCVLKRERVLPRSIRLEGRRERVVPS